MQCHLPEYDGAAEGGGTMWCIGWTSISYSLSWWANRLRWERTGRPKTDITSCYIQVFILIEGTFKMCRKLPLYASHKVQNWSGGRVGVALLWSLLHHPSSSPAPSMGPCKLESDKSYSSRTERKTWFNFHGAFLHFQKGIVSETSSGKHSLVDECLENTSALISAHWNAISNAIIIKVGWFMPIQHSLNHVCLH